MRLFIAALLPASFKAHLRTYESQILGEGIRLISEANLHLTLHFIGEYPAADVPALQNTLIQVAQQHVPFQLTPQEIAPGPKARSPRLIWVRFEGHPAYEQLASAIARALEVKPGVNEEFIPHITLARFQKDRRPTKIPPIIKPIEISTLEISSFALWESRLQSPHPEYKILQEFALANSTAAL